VDAEEAQAIRAEGLDADDPAVIAAMDLVGWELFARYEIPAFAAHLKDFSSDGPRGGVLKRIGTTRRFRYRFRDPLMPTYVLMRGRLAGLDRAEDAEPGAESAS
jgi:hypothetical protein